MKYNEKLDRLLDIYQRGVPESAQKLLIFEDAFNSVQPQLLLAESYHNRIEEVTNEQLKFLRDIDEKLRQIEEIKEKRSSEK